MNPWQQTVDLLLRTTYAELFERMQAEQRNAILAIPGAVAHLQEHLRDAGASATSRFLAAELLHTALPGFPSAEDAALLAGVYAGALAATDDGGAWGLPGRWDHKATRHFIALGAPALAALDALLGDDRRIAYTGSKRATLGEFYRVRVKDIAAHIASAITGTPFDQDRSPEVRDAAIDALRARIRSMQP